MTNQWNQPITIASECDDDIPQGDWIDGYDTQDAVEEELRRLRLSHRADLYIAYDDVTPDSEIAEGRWIIYEMNGIDDAGKGHGPSCECGACECSALATCLDDGGIPVCDACSDYTVDEDGEVHCSNCDDGQ